MRKHFDELLILFVALAYGFSYSFQSIGAQYVSAFSFSAIKNFIAFVTLLILHFVRKNKNNNIKKILLIGFIIGADLTLFNYLQQIVALQNTPGKTGFITSMYIVEVPLVNYLFYKEKINLQTILSLIFAVFGLVFISDLSNFTINMNDILTIICSLCLCIQIVVIGKYCGDVDPMDLTMCSSFFTFLFCFIGAFIFKESISLNNCVSAIGPILYLSIVCTTIAIPTQAFAQRTLDGTTVSLILSLESLFSIFAGYLLLDEAFTKKELIGCLLMFIAVILCVTADKQKKTKE